MKKFYLFSALFFLISIHSQLLAQAFGLKIQSCFSKVNIEPVLGVTSNGLKPSLFAGFFVEDRFNDHDAVGIELSVFQIKNQISGQYTRTISGFFGPSTSQSYPAEIENKIKFIVLNGYYRHLRGRWGLKGGMQCIIPLIETNKVTNTQNNTTFNENNTNNGFSNPYLKLGITGGLEFAIDKRFRLGVDYYKEIRHITKRRNQAFPGLQIFSVGLKFSFIKSRYKFT